LTSIFHTVSTGEFAVDAFFLLSGYLITKSMMLSGSVMYYLERRVLRIYPGYLAAYLLSAIAVGAVVGARPWTELPLTAARSLFLMDPMRYPGQLVPALNGSMWTIAYEFRCYLLIAALWSGGLLLRRRVMAIITLAVVLVGIAMTIAPIQKPVDLLAEHIHGFGWIIGIPSDAMRLTSAFLVGALFYIYRDVLIEGITIKRAILCGLLAGALLYRDPHFANAGLTTLGAISLFWLALKAKIGPLRSINDSWDISYGTYLYGWPVAVLIIWFYPNISPWILAGVALPFAWACGCLSWWGVEKWTKDLKGSHSTLGGRSRKEAVF
jgi:peptidoglycan/LPS O-acetylase OafA/YrhL